MNPGESADPLNVCAGAGADLLLMGDSAWMDCNRLVVPAPLQDRLERSRQLVQGDHLDVLAYAMFEAVFPTVL